ncbi:cytochrome b [Rhodovulum sp. DZ06]|uniref:cytochrome b n=1 Tax=Rhodovulum sp. DZ06 TaxID=3425126 RepID=UPI003D349B8E
MPPIRNTARTWGVPARILHWGMAGLLLFLVGLGIYTADFVTDTYEQFALVQLHKSWGFVAFALGAARLLWRLVNPAPEMPEGTPALTRLVAHGGHAALYVLMFAIPLSGWLMASASPLQELYGVKNMVFGLFELPDPFVPGDQKLQATLRSVHFWAAMALLAVVAGHAAAALKHHFIDKDDVLRRMTRG